MEVWKAIPGYCGMYAASSLGRIRSKWRGGRILRPGDNGTGYKQVHLTDTFGKNYQRTVHRLVMVAFHGDSDAEVNHINGNRADNRLTNLEWCTRSHNARHKFKIGYDAPKGRKCSLSKKYLITHPCGRKEVIVGLRQFCRDHGLDMGTMVGVSKGRHTAHKEFRCERID